jgi:uncharacterized protein with PQ loop repeat
MNENYIEYIGYLASLFVAISFTLKNINSLRIVNSIGCVAFIIYGLLIDSVPVMITNLFIVLFNIYYLWIKKQ